MPERNIQQNLRPVKRVLYELRKRDRAVQKIGANKWKALCPAHDDHKPSLSITEAGDGTAAIHCFAGCSAEAILAALDLSIEDLFPRPFGTPKKSRKEIACYDYVDENGELLFQTVRFEPKNFRQRRPDGKGNWIWNLKGVRRVLYDLPRIVEADPDTPVHICEGEKDCDSLTAHGLLATTCPMGAGKWHRVDDSPLHRQHVRIIPDNDQAGHKHAESVAQALYGKAASVKIIELPGLPEHGDVSDWISLLKGKDVVKELSRLAEAAQIYEPRNSLPVINYYDLELHSLTKKCLEVLHAKNVPPVLFVRGGELSRVIRDEKGNARIKYVGKQAMRLKLAEAALFVSEGGRSRNGKRKAPPDKLVESILAKGEWDFPALSGISVTPILRPDGSIVVEPGYDPVTQLYYIPPPGFTVPPIPEKPTTTETESAIGLLRDLINDFPFVNDADKANALALLLTMLMRPVIEGNVPLAIVSAPRQGTGKSLLVLAVGVLASGGVRVQSVPTRQNDDEMRKRITSTLLEGSPVAVLDNVPEYIVLDFPSLAATLTAYESGWTDRRLAKNEMVCVPANTIWVATGNNLRVGGDIPRRCYSIKMDANMEQPWKRSDFKYLRLIEHVREHRGELLRAVLTLVRAWYATEQPQPRNLPTFGGFEEWKCVVGGVLQHAGVRGFLKNLDEIHTSQDTETAQWTAFAEAWWQTFGREPATVKRLCSEILSDGRLSASKLADTLPDTLAGKVGKGEGSFRKSLGVQLSQRESRVFGKYKLVKAEQDSHEKVNCWQLKELHSRGSAEVAEVIL